MGAQPVNYSSECSIRTFFELHVYSKIPNNWGGGVCICVSVGGCLFGSVCGLIHTKLYFWFLGECDWGRASLSMNGSASGFKCKLNESNSLGWVKNH